MIHRPGKNEPMKTRGFDLYRHPGNREVLTGISTTRAALENACAVVAATGGSTNAALHIPAIAHEAGIRFDIDDVDAVSRRTPLIADLRPSGLSRPRMCTTSAAPP
jgi:dihydroxyacid dehydratase/phosphogluconate dehydratase